MQRGSGQPDSKRMKVMNPYVQLKRSFVCNARPAIANQFNNQATSDILLCVGSLKFHVHRLVLMSASEMFASWLSENWKGDNERELTLTESEQWMEDFLRFFYTGHIVMNSESIADVYMLADKYLVTSLLRECSVQILDGLRIKLEERSCYHVIRQESSRSRAVSASGSGDESDRDIDVENGEMVTRSELFCDKCKPGRFIAEETFSIPTVARIAQFSDPQLVRAARFNLMIRLAVELRSGRYRYVIDLPHALLKELLQDDNFDSTEFHLFCAVKHWVEAHRSDKAADVEEEAFSGLINELLSLIRFPLMTNDELYECEKSASGLFPTEPFRGLLHEALRYIVYRNCPKARLQENWTGPQFRPRQPTDIIEATDSVGHYSVNVSVASVL